MKPCTVLALPLCGFLALLASPVSAEVLYDREGMQLQGTARIVSQNAATCNVLEEKYSPEEYEKLKANQGSPSTSGSWISPLTTRPARLSISSGPTSPSNPPGPPAPTGAGRAPAAARRETSSMPKGIPGLSSGPAP